MKINYYDCLVQKFINPSKKFGTDKKIFLAGPTPRNDSEKEFEWRENVVSLLGNRGFNGMVYVPQFKHDDSMFEEYSDFPEWELKRIDSSDIILFWVPRQKEVMKAMTTNVEFGYCLSKFPEKVFYARPENAVKIRYLDFLYKRETGENHIPTNTQDLVGRISTILIFGQTKR